MNGSGHRRRRLTALALGAVIAATWLALAAGGGAAAANTWSGTWSRAEDGVSGSLILTQSGSSVSGRYTWNDGSGRVSGTVSGSLLTAGFNETHYRGSIVAHLAGKQFTGSYSGENKDTGGSISGPFNGVCVSGDCLGNGTTPAKPPACRASATAGDPRAHFAAINEVHVTAVCPDVQFHKGGTPADAWLPLEPDTVLKAGDEITCDPDGKATLAFADNSTVDVSDTTQLKIGSFFTEGGVVRTEILLKMGQVAAQVNKSEATKSDFRIKEPSGPGSVRGATDAEARAASAGAITVEATNGARVSVFRAPGADTVLVSNYAGLVAVTPASSSAHPFLLPAGDAVDLTAGSVSPFGAIGHVGLRGGIDIATAQKLVSSVIGRNRRPCRDNVAHGYAFSIRPAPAGWKVAVTLGGRTPGTALFTVSKRRVAPANALARRLTRGCRR